MTHNPDDRRLDDQPLEHSPALRRLQLARRQTAALIRVLRETDTTDTRTTHTHPPGSLPGDEQALRGIPVVGARGIGGHITGTQPGSNR